MRALPAVLFAIVVLVYSACGPHDNGNPRQDLYLTLRTLAPQVTTITMFINANGGEFAGSDGNCVIGAIVPDGVVTSAETDSGQLEVTITGTMHGGDLIAICQFSAESGIDPDFTIEIADCKDNAVSKVCSITATVENIPQCGNEVVDGGEECDEGPEDTADCDDDCTDVECGDEHQNSPAGEECDDGNTANSDGCSSTCKDESPTTTSTTEEP